MASSVAFGAINGITQSTISSTQELLSFHNPHRSFALSSVNSTTSAAGMTEFTQAFYNPKTYKNIKQSYGELKEQTLKKKVDLGMENPTLKPFEKVMSGYMAYSENLGGKALTPENYLTDIVKEAMILDSEGVGVDGMMGGFMKSMTESVDENGAIDMKKVSKKLASSGKDFFKNSVVNNEKAYKGQSKWFLDEDTSFKVGEKDVHLKKRQSMGERMSLFVDANRDIFDTTFDYYDSGDAKMMGMKATNVKNTDEYVEYLKNIEPGAYGTTKALRNAGFYDKGTPMSKKITAFSYETMNGSPLWSRTLEKQIKKGTAKIQHEIPEVLDDIGNVIEKGRGKIRIEGGGKIGRAAALVADTAIMGGAIGGAVGGLGYLATMPFHKKKKDNQRVQSNKPINQMGR